MCLAIYKPKGVQISKAYLHNGYSENKDGCGFAFARKNRVEVYKGFESFKTFWQAIKPLQGKHAMLIHFRFATHGDKSDSNVHPVLINGGKIAVIHNGIISIKTHGNDSDTVTFAKQVLQPCFSRFAWKDATLKYLIETSIGTHNKIAALNHKGEAVIYNESSGHWHKGAWYSNNGYEGNKRWFHSIGDYASDCYAKWSHRGNQKTVYRYTQSDVFDQLDEDELAAESIATCNLGVPDKESSNQLDYSGTSHHAKPLVQLHYNQEETT